MTESLPISRRSVLAAAAATAATHDAILLMPDELSTMLASLGA